jgi:PAS domain S-box-containing protein
MSIVSNTEDGTGRSTGRFVERRQTERQIAELQFELTFLAAEDFHRSLASRLAATVGTECAFVGRLALPTDPSLQTLGLWLAEGSAAIVPARIDVVGAPPAPVAHPDGLSYPDEQLALWLRRCGWARRLGNLDLAVWPLLACDGSLIGVIGLADSGKLQAEDPILRTKVAAFARIAERVVERDNAVLAMQKERAQYTALVQATAEAVVTIDSRQRILNFNPAAERLFRRSASEVVGTPLGTLVPADVRERHERIVQRQSSATCTARLQGKTWEARGLRSDGTQIPIQIAVCRADVGGDAIHTAIIHEMTGPGTGK